jgi:hypothetical protein
VRCSFAAWGEGGESARQKLFLVELLGLGRRGLGGSHSLPGRLFGLRGLTGIGSRAKHGMENRGRTLVGRNGLQKKGRVEPSRAPAEGSPQPSVGDDSGRKKV